MRALPPDVESATELQSTGLSCPDCLGVLRVVAEGNRRALFFRCRTGHTYAAHEVIAAKELRLEEHLWSALTIVDELQTFLRELEPLKDHRDCAPAYERRAAQADVQAAALRALLQRLQRTGLDMHGEDDDDGE
jgi:two-component system chemotaxis response regulator CheB